MPCEARWITNVLLLTDVVSAYVLQYVPSGPSEETTTSEDMAAIDNPVDTILHSARKAYGFLQPNASDGKRKY